MKTCSACGVAKPLADFNRRGDGYRNDCRACRNTRRRVHYAANRESILARQRELRAADPDFKRKARIQNRRHADKKRAYWREYRKTRRLQVQASVRRWQKAHPERMRELKRKSEAKRRARKRMLPVEDVDPRLVFERDGGICGICGESIDPSDWHLDHIIPLAQGGPHTYANTQATHPFCNLSKGGRGDGRQGEYH